jgi:hypothetical protein
MDKTMIVSYFNYNNMEYNMAKAKSTTKKPTPGKTGMGKKGC